MALGLAALEAAGLKMRVPGGLVLILELSPAATVSTLNGGVSSFYPTLE